METAQSRQGESKLAGEIKFVDIISEIYEDLAENFKLFDLGEERSEIVRRLAKAECEENREKAIALRKKLYFPLIAEKIKKDFPRLHFTPGLNQQIIRFAVADREEERQVEFDKLMRATVRLHILQKFAAIFPKAIFNPEISAKSEELVEASLGDDEVLAGHLQKQLLVMLFSADLREKFVDVDLAKKDTVNEVIKSASAALDDEEKVIQSEREKLELFCVKQSIWEKKVKPKLLASVDLKLVSPQLERIISALAKAKLEKNSDQESVFLHQLLKTIFTINIKQQHNVDERSSEKELEQVSACAEIAVQVDELTDQLNSELEKQKKQRFIPARLREVKAQPKISIAEVKAVQDSVFMLTQAVQRKRMELAKATLLLSEMRGQSASMESKEQRTASVTHRM